MVPDDEYIFKHGDPRMTAYPLMENPRIAMSLIMAYFVFVKLIGPMWMKRREAYKLRNMMIVYNLLTSALNAWIFLNMARSWLTKYRLRCEPIDFSDNEDALKMVQVCWVFIMSKFLEFSDTIFAVLRKKDSQVSKLHVFHHCFAPATIWYAVKYGPGGYNTLLMMVNSFVHIWMYLYYGLAALGPKLQKHLWWKKYLTTLQLAQFTIGILYMGQLYFFSPDHCKVSGYLVSLNLSNAIIFLILFLNFYSNTYKTKKVV